MGTTVPIDLIRLRSATAAYVAILHDSLPALEGLVEAATMGPAEPGAEHLAALRDSVEAAVDIEDAPGTPAAILTSLVRLIGVPRTSATVPAAGAMALAAPSFRIGDASSPRFVEMPTMELTDEQWHRIDQAFWSAVVLEFPEVETGDLDLMESQRWQAAGRRAISRWLALNHPQGGE